MEHYELSVPKWMVWAFPIGCIAVFLICFQIFKFLFHTKTCRDFQTPQEAQRTFISNQERYKNLDLNHDGIACNGL